MAEGPGGLVINGKSYVPPGNEEVDFKTLFRRLTSLGAGRPVDKDGFPQGPWTADLLAEAISQIDANRAGVDLRTVQLWFQENEKGIGAENIRWLARIFGCGDPEATSAWQAELSAANRRLAARRREMRLAEGLATSSSNASEQDQKMLGRGINLARWVELVFDRGNALSLPIAVWSGSAVLAFLSYVIGTHSITYSAAPGLEKQVGFLWAPSWTLDRIVFVASFLFVVSETLHSWKTEKRPSVLANGARQGADGGWRRRVDEISPMCWLVLGACFLVVFIGQSVGVYWRALTQGSAGKAMVDWILVTIERPDLVSIETILAVSGFANFFSFFVYWAYFSGLLFLYAISVDFRNTVGTFDAELSYDRHKGVEEVGHKLIRSIFCCAILGILSATSIKLNAAYLISDGNNILSWLLGDFLYVLGVNGQSWGWLEKSAWSFITSFFVFFSTCFVFFACLAQIKSGLEMANALEENNMSRGRRETDRNCQEARMPWLMMIGVVVVLSVNFVLLGTFHGFSVVLLFSVTLAATALYNGNGSIPQNGL